MRAFVHTLAEVSEPLMAWCTEFVQSEHFRLKFLQICQVDTIPEVSLAEMKIIKVNLIDGLNMTQNEAHELGNAVTLMCTWLDAILEFTILKHEVTVLRLQS